MSSDPSSAHRNSRRFWSFQVSGDVDALHIVRWVSLRSNVKELRYHSARTTCPVSFSFQCTKAENFVPVRLVEPLGESRCNEGRKREYDHERGKLHCRDGLQDGEILNS